LYDPDITGVGHQPMMFDQWMTMYERYLVFAHKVDVHFTNTTASNNALVALLLKNVSTLTTNPTTVQERAHAVHRILGPQGTDKALGRLSKYSSTASIWGVPKRRLNTTSSDYVGSDTSNPTNKVFIQVGCGDPLGSVTVTAEAIVNIKYYCVFFRRIAQNPS